MLMVVRTSFSRWLLLLLATFAACACACEFVLTHAEIAGDRARAVEFGGAAANSRLGYVTNGAGDINGDGFADFALAAPNENADTGAIYLIFGRNSAAWSGAQFDFSAAETPDGASWIRISGNATGEKLGTHGIARGDFNGDGLSDLLFGAFVVYGRRGAWSSFNVDEIGSTAVPGFAITGGTTMMLVGNAGDMNGDGVEDLLVTNTGSNDPSVSSVIFGATGATRNTFDIGTIDGTNGFSFIDESTTLGFGDYSSVDVNGDGLADLVVGSFVDSSDGHYDFVGHAYILFASNVSATGHHWDAWLNLTADIDGTNGFIVEGDSFLSFLGHVAVGAGDVNADGFPDIFIGSNTNKNGAWLLLGHPAPWEQLFVVSQLNGTNGFHFASGVGEGWGIHGGGVGDVNGDGIDDIIISGLNSPNSLGVQTGAVAVLFGHAGPWPAELNKSNAVGSMGFLIDGPSAGSRFGSSVKGVGDVNGDGLADFIIGAPEHNTTSTNSFAGYAVLVFGVDDHCAVCSNTTDSCIVCDDGLFSHGSICSSTPAASSPSSSSSKQDGSSQQLPSSTASSHAADDVDAAHFVSPFALAPSFAAALALMMF